MDAEVLAEFVEVKGRPCPRVELDPSLSRDAQIASIFNSDQGGGAWALELLRLSVPLAERRETLLRVNAAVNDHIVQVARAAAAEAEASEREHKRRGRG